jgi:hypothetical protein
MPVQTQDYQDAQSSLNDAQHQQQVAGITDSSDLQQWAQENNLSIVQDANGQMLDLVDSQNNTALKLTVSGLQDQADAQQLAATTALTQAQLNYQSQQDLLQNNMDAQIAILETGVENGTLTAQQFQSGVALAMSTAGLSVAAFAGLMGTSFGTEFADAMSDAVKAVNALADAYRALDQVTGQSHPIDTSTAQTAAQYVASLPQVTPTQLAGMSYSEIAANIASEIAALGGNLSPIKMAAGGIVSRRVGGVPLIAGEGKYDEAVVPLSPANLAAMSGGGGGGGPTVINVNVTVPGTLVGSGGMQDLAEAIRVELQQSVNRGYGSNSLVGSIF